MTSEQIYTARLLGKIIRGECPADEKLPEGVCAEDFIGCVKANGVFLLTGDVILRSVSGELAEKMKQALLRSILREVTQSSARQRILDAAEKEGVDLLLLKGSSVRRFYPEPEKREMYDIDLLYRYPQKRKADRLMRGLGFDTVALTLHHTKWVDKESGVVAEMHHSICEEDTFGNEYFSGIFSRMEPEEGYSHIFHMSPEDAYIHSLLHLRHHFRCGNHNLRQIADLYCLRIKTGLSAEAAERTAASLGAGVFAADARALCTYLFEGGEKTDARLEKLADYYFKNITFTDELFAPDETMFNTGSRAGYFLSVVFPKKERVYINFPFIAEHRFLLPFGYLLRLLQCFTVRRGNVGKKVRSIKELDGRAGTEEDKKNFFREYGA